VFKIFREKDKQIILTILLYSKINSLYLETIKNIERISQKCIKNQIKQYLEKYID